MENLIRKLKKFTVKLETNKDKLFILENGEDVTELIKKCQSDQDIINLAKKLIDDLIPNEDDEVGDWKEDYAKNFLHDNAETYYYNKFDYDDFDEDNEDQQKQVITKYHSPEKLSKDDLEEKQEQKQEELAEFEANKTTEDKLLEFLKFKCLNFDDCETWAEVFEILGYNYPEVFNELPFDSPYDIIEITENNEDMTKLGVPNDNNTENEIDTNKDGKDLTYYKKFYNGELNEIEHLMIVNSVIQHCQEIENDYESDLELEDADDIDEDLDCLYDIIKNENKLLDHPNDELNANLKAARYDYDKLMELWNTVDQLHEIEEDKIFNSDDGEVIGSKSENKKRKRIHFDIKDDPIAEMRFEMKQTDLILDKESMKMLIKEIAQDFDVDLNFDDEAFEVLQTASESYLIDLFGKASMEGIHGLRTHIQPKDIQITRRVRDEYY